MKPNDNNADIATTIERALYAPEGVCSFDFFQAIRMLILLGLRDRQLVGDDGPPDREIVRFLAHLSLAFPASNVQSLKPATANSPPTMTVNFLGMTGPNGVLPRHYTERIWSDAKPGVRPPLQDWLDLFNHRFVSFFYRAWEKYRFFLPFERNAAGEALALPGPKSKRSSSAEAGALLPVGKAKSATRDPDLFSRCLYSLIGMGFRSHRNRFRIAWLESKPEQIPVRAKELGQLDDLALLRFSGLFAHRPRCALSLEIFLQTYLRLPVKVQQFQGQWFHLGTESQSSMGSFNNQLGQDTLVGDRIWDVQSKVRIRLGPLSYDQFVEFLPERTPRTRRKRIFLLAQLVRQYLGPALDVDFQLILKKNEVPATQMGTNSRLGWNTWAKRQPYPRHADDTIFSVPEQVWLNSD